MSDQPTQQEKTALLRALHQGDTPLLLPNIWDAIGAGLVEDLGFPVVATSSSAMALSEGYLDGQQLPFEMLLNRIRSIQRVTNLSVTVDIENGFANDNQQLRSNIEALIETGISGVNYEDTDKQTKQFIPLEIQCERIRLIKETAQASGGDLFINARVDTYVYGSHLSHEDKLEAAIYRGRAYRDAGAECIFPILLTDTNHIRTLVRELSMPINIMAFPGIPSLKELQQLGVKRISVGGSLLKIAIQSIKAFSTKFKDMDGIETLFTSGITSDYLNQLVLQKHQHS
ncbi:MAG: isocitrate lyase/phosphoenolpyruvate mutase family protein [Chitinophagales bacterium]|nr:isocitrate lyase/phosphoenolpyruvate mutase family protein [Chitinophagales bacterium]